MIVLKDISIAPTAGDNIKPIEANIPAARGTAITLYTAPPHKFRPISFIVFYERDKKLIISEGLLLTSMTSPDSIATSVPAPIAIPISALIRLGASLIPSPTIMILLPLL